MTGPCGDTDFDTIHAIINDGAEAYRGVIPADRWHEPYMSQDELRHEIENGVQFWGYKDGGELLGVMGIQDVQDVTLIRHAYVRTALRAIWVQGGSQELGAKDADRPLADGTRGWRVERRFPGRLQADEDHGFQCLNPSDRTDPLPYQKFALGHDHRLPTQQNPILLKTDAFDGTPVLDIKPFLPGYDTADDAKVPGWAKSN